MSIEYHKWSYPILINLINMNFNLIVEKRRDRITAIKIVRTDKTRSQFLKSYLVQLKKKMCFRKRTLFYRVTKNRSVDIGVLYAPFAF